ncbi:glycosyltransferase family 4 protein [Patescibacteria group bacterium]|nr:glycosyltransferase family 4 protein [Patescibacteria group bacterium]MCL5091438.1 glycosyltransferase family 4 protein [Patescibacteria group bacterium]
MRKPTAALYNPFLDTLGGGEKHILSVLKVLEEFGYQITIFWNDNLEKQIKDKFSLSFQAPLRFAPNLFHRPSQLKRLITLRQFDMLFYVTDGSYFFSTAKQNYIFCMVPQQNLYQRTIINRLKMANFNFISNSRFTQSWLQHWHIPSQVIYPYLASEFIDLDLGRVKKDNIILSVGRFFNQLHAKQHAKIIDAFNKLKLRDTSYKKFTLILAGGFKNEDIQYVKELSQLTQGRSDVRLVLNPDFPTLFDWYKRARYYWHFTGYGVDVNTTPQAAEHLGITPLEAMAAGCITFCHDAGGPREIVESGKNGFLFSQVDQLIEQMQTITDPQLIQQQAKARVTSRFCYPVFKNRVKEVLSLSQK